MKENLFYISSGENFLTPAASYFTFLEGQTASAAPICYWVKNITQTIRQIFELSLGIFQVCKTLASKKKTLLSVKILREPKKRFLTHEKF